MCEYSPEFEELWKLFGATKRAGLGNRGSKPRAFKEFKGLPGKMSQREWLEYLGPIIVSQAQEKIDSRRKNEFAENFQHVERYLKNRRYEDDEEIGKNYESLPSATIEEQMREKMRALNDTSWAKRFLR